MFAPKYCIFKSLPEGCTMMRAGHYRTLLSVRFHAARCAVVNTPSEHVSHHTGPCHTINADLPYSFRRRLQQPSLPQPAPSSSSPRPPTSLARPRTACARPRGSTACSRQPSRRPQSAECQERKNLRRRRRRPSLRGRRHRRRRPQCGRRPGHLRAGGR